MKYRVFIIGLAFTLNAVAMENGIPVECKPVAEKYILQGEFAGGEGIPGARLWDYVGLKSHYRSGAKIPACLHETLAQAILEMDDYWSQMGLTTGCLREVPDEDGVPFPRLIDEVELEGSGCTPEIHQAVASNIDLIDKAVGEFENAMDEPERFEEIDEELRTCLRSEFFPEVLGLPVKDLASQWDEINEKIAEDAVDEAGFDESLLEGASDYCEKRNRLKLDREMDEIMGESAVQGSAPGEALDPAEENQLLQCAMNAGAPIIDTVKALGALGPLLYEAVNGPDSAQKILTTAMKSFFGGAWEAIKGIPMAGVETLYEVGDFFKCMDGRERVQAVCSALPEMVMYGSGGAGLFMRFTSRGMRVAGSMSKATGRTARLKRGFASAALWRKTITKPAMLESRLLGQMARRLPSEALRKRAVTPARMLAILDKRRVAGVLRSRFHIRPNRPLPNRLAHPLSFGTTRKTLAREVLGIEKASSKSLPELRAAYRARKAEIKPYRNLDTAMNEAMQDVAVDLSAAEIKADRLSVRQTLKEERKILDAAFRFLKESAE